MRERRMLKGEREIFTYVDLYQAALLSARRIPKSRLDSMTAILYCAFLLEAYMNHIGSRRFAKEEWRGRQEDGRDGLERCNPKDKLDTIANKINFKFDPGRAPFQSFFMIFKFRDALVHGKTVVEPLDDEQIIESGRLPEFPKTEWEKMLKTPATAKTFFEHTEAILKELHTASGLDQEHDLLGYNSRWKFEAWALDEGANPAGKRTIESEEET